MNGYLKLNEVVLGEINLKLIDETMGVIGGTLIPHSEYFNYQNNFQTICENKGIPNSDDFPFSLEIPNVIKIGNGIGVTDIAGIADVEIEAVGLPYEVLTKLIL